MTHHHAHAHAAYAAHDTHCTECGAEIKPAARAQLGYTTCLRCGDAAARKVKHTIAPLPKSNYILITDMSMLKGLNSSHRGNR